MATPLPRNRVDLTASDVADITGGVLVDPGSSARITSVSTNTRELSPGAVFVALRGLAHDGHDHVHAAAEAGAAAAIVDRDVDAPSTMAVVRVGSTLRALGDLARDHVERWRARGGKRTVVGITGSAGKTTTRVATAALLESLFPGELLATRGNLNNRIGVPMVLLSLAPEHRVAVLELGTSEPGEIEELCRISQPDVGILTLIAAAHVEGLGSLEGVALEKSALFRSLTPGGIAVGNGDDTRIRSALETAPCKRVTYGRGRTTDLRVAEREPIGLTHSRVVVTDERGRRQLETPLVGEAGALACAAAIAAVEAAFDVRLDGPALTDAFARVEVGEGAQRLVPLLLASGLAVLDDTYNANPASMSSSIRAAAEMARATERTLVLVLGEMRELGSEAARGHEEVGRVAAEAGARRVIVVGGGETKRMAEVARGGGAEVLHLPSVDEGLTAIDEALRASDLVLVKGSRSSGTERVVAHLRLSDRA